MQLPHSVPALSAIHHYNIKMRPVSEKEKMGFRVVYVCCDPLEMGT